MFATLVDDSGRPVRSRRGFRFPVGVGLGLHAAVALSFLAARAWSIEDPAEPPIPIVYYDAPAPPLGDGGNEQSVRRAKDQSDEPKKGIATEVAPERLDAEAAPEPAAQTRETAVEGGKGDDASAAGTGTDDGGGTPGDPNGRPNGREGNTGTGDPADPIYTIDQGVAPPALVLRVEPVYPETARKIRTEGIVVVEAVISGTGLVEQVRVVKSAHPLLDAAAVAAVEKWRYRPASLNGRPVRVLLTVSVTFALH